MEAATAKKMMAEFRVGITAQVAALEQRLGVDAAQLSTVIALIHACYRHGASQESQSVSS